MRVAAYNEEACIYMYAFIAGPALTLVKSQERTPFNSRFDVIRGRRLSKELTDLREKQAFTCPNRDRTPLSG